MERNVFSYHSASINPSYASIWYNIEGLPKKQNLIDAYFALNDPEKKEKPENLKNNSHKNKISPVAMKKIKKAIDYLTYIAQPKNLPPTIHGKDFKFKLSFITLTLSSEQIHSDQEIKDVMFQPFLNLLRKKWKVKSYVWRAEKQHNNNIHFHIVCDQFIPWNEIRNKWNALQQELGYVTRYRENQKAYHANGFNFRPHLAPKWDYQSQLKAWKAGLKTDWGNPNSTDVHSLKLVSNIRAYFVKCLASPSTVFPDYYNGLALKGEFIKDTQIKDCDLGGRLWGCSENLSNLDGARIDHHSDFPDELNKLFNDPKFYSHHGQYFSVVYFDPTRLKKYGYHRIIDILETFIKIQFPEYRPENLFYPAAVLN